MVTLSPSNAISQPHQRRYSAPASTTTGSAGRTKTGSLGLPVDQTTRKKELLRSLLYLGGAGLGVGVGARAGSSLLSFLRPSAAPVARTSSVPEEIRIPIPTPSMHSPMEDEEEKIASAEPLRFLAGKLAGKQADLGKTVADLVPQQVYDGLPSIANSGHPFNSWWGMPAAAATGAAGIAGGWTLMDQLLNARRKGQMQGDVEDARDDFRSALGEEYQAAMAAKNAAGEDQGEDPLADAYHMLKTAGSLLEQGEQQITDWSNALSGLYLTGALGLGGAAGVGTYNWAKNRSQQNMLRKAIAARARARQMPQPVYAVPTHDLANA